LAGLVNVRGELQLCVHLEQLFGLGQSAGADVKTNGKAAGRMLVVRREGDGWVFPVDEVDRVHRFPARALMPPPATVTRSTSRLTLGTFTLQGRAVGLLDGGRLFEALRAKAR
jgi:chemotaxis-related protein WspD